MPWLTCSWNLPPVAYGGEGSRAKEQPRNTRASIQFVFFPRCINCTLNEVVSRQILFWIAFPQNRSSPRLVLKQDPNVTPCMMQIFRMDHLTVTVYWQTPLRSSFQPGCSSLGKQFRSYSTYVPGSPEVRFI